MIPIIIPGSVVRRASDAVKGGARKADEKTGGGAGRKKAEIDKKAAEKKKAVAESDSMQKLGEKKAAASAAIDEQMGRFGKWRKEKSAELSAWADQKRGATVVAKPGEAVKPFAKEDLTYPESGAPKFELMMVPEGCAPGDTLATPAGREFVIPRGGVPGATLRLPLMDPAAAPVAVATPIEPEPEPQGKKGKKSRKKGPPVAEAVPEPTKGSKKKSSKK